MVYLKKFKLLNNDEEYEILCLKKLVFTTLYPLKMFPEKEFEVITFEPIIIFYGGNSSGKTTLLNIIAEKIDAVKKIEMIKENCFAGMLIRVMSMI